MRKPDGWPTFMETCIVFLGMVVVILIVGWVYVVAHFVVKYW